MPKKLTEPDYDRVRDVGSPPLVYTERTIADSGWHITVVAGNVLVSLQCTQIGASDVAFQSLLRKAGLGYLIVGAKTAKAMGISRWFNIQLIPEPVYESHIAAVIANANADVLERPFRAILEEMERDSESSDAPERP